MCVGSSRGPKDQSGGRPNNNTSHIGTIRNEITVAIYMICKQPQSGIRNHQGIRYVFFGGLSRRASEGMSSAIRMNSDPPKPVFIGRKGTQKKARSAITRARSSTPPHPTQLSSLQGTKGRSITMHHRPSDRMNGRVVPKCCWLLLMLVEIHYRRCYRTDR